jgi:hypothetical protein
MVSKDYSYTQLIVKDTVCWICGKSQSENLSLTSHHCLPKSFNPKKNIIVPLCWDCHDKLNNQDISSMYNFSAKILKESQNLVQQTAKLNKYVENNFKIKLKTKVTK